jgi:hypothetical protein
MRKYFLLLLTLLNFLVCFSQKPIEKNGMQSDTISKKYYMYGKEISYSEDEQIKKKNALRTNTSWKTKNIRTESIPT